VSELNNIKWTPASESITALRARFIALFNRARLSEWQMRRNYILGIFDDEMQRAIRFPPTEESFWQEAQSYYLTEMTLASSCFKTKTPGRKAVSSSSSTSESSSVVCYTCGKPGHVSPNCPTKLSAGGAANSNNPGTDSSSKFRVGPICFNCGAKGHVRDKCTSKVQTKEGTIAEEAYRSRVKKCSPTPADKKPPVSKNRLGTEGLGSPWTSPYYTLDTSPKSSTNPPLDPIPPPFGLVPSNLV
jgi:Zinc knuckle